MKYLYILFNFVSFILLGLVMFSCSDSSQIDPKDAISSFINNNDAIVAFGTVDLKGILDKVDYENVPKIGKLLSTEVTTIERFIDLKSPLYYAMQGPLDLDGSPEATYAFLGVLNSDSLAVELTQRGFDIGIKNEIQFCQDGDIAIGIKENLAIVVSKSSDFDTEKLITETFAKVDGTISGGSVDEILSQEGDFVLGVNMHSLYTTSNTDLGNLDDDMKRELDEALMNTYVQTVIKFEDGAAILETKNYFSDKLKGQMFFNSDESAPIVAKLGKGKARFGLSMNLDMKKMQAFIDAYSPETMQDLASLMGGPAQMALMAAGDDGLAGLFNGKFGIVMLGDPDLDGALVPDFNFYLGLAPRGQDLAQMAKGMLDYAMAEVSLDKDGISGYSNSSYSPGYNGKIVLPKGCENFGKSGISAFINFEGLDFDEMDLEGGGNVLRVVKYITFDYDENGGRLYIKAKEGKENILKQAIGVLVEEFSSEITGISI
jgi:hypothetical protein